MSTIRYTTHEERRKNKNVRVEDMSGVIHSLLEGAVSMRKDGRTTTETHALAKVVATLFAEITIPTIDTCLDGDTLTWNEVFDAWPDCGNDASSFMTKN